MVMYAPHSLYVKRIEQLRDDTNRTVGIKEDWSFIGMCRCDDNGTNEIVDENGNAFIPTYHIVTSRYDIRTGDIVRVMDGDSIRGQGKIRRVIRTNYFNYMSLYV
nr:MAG TPA: 50S ribosomal protein L32 [Caudoviricetes sp.]